MIHRLRQQLSELLIIEDLQRTAGRNFTHRTRMETVMVIAVARLNKYSRIGETFGIDFAGDVVQMNSLAYVTAGVFDGAVAIDIAQLTETEAI